MKLRLLLPTSICLALSLTTEANGWEDFNAVDWIDYEEYCWNASEESSWEAQIDIVGGYRWDDITTELNAQRAGNTTILKNNLSIQSIHTYDIGAHGWLFWDDWFLRGEFSYGWSDHASFGTNTRVYDPKHETFTRAKVHSGNTQDQTIGVGYLFPFCWLRLGPLVGWSFDQVRVKMEHVKVDHQPIHALDGFTYRTKWQGPWVGLEGMFLYYGYDVDFGYEYHFPHWNGKFQLRGPNLPGVTFSDTRKGNNGYGSLALSALMPLFFVGSMQALH